MTEYENNIIQKLLDFTIPEFYDSLHILFTNCDLIPRLLDENGQQRIVVIEGVNELSENAKETVNVALKRWKEKTQTIREKLEFDQTELEKWVKRLLDFIQNPQQIPAFLLGKEMIEGLTADLISQCISKYQVQSNIFDKNGVMRQLSKKIGLLEPWSQASVCGNCNIFELLLSSLPQKQTKCSRCEQDMSTVRIYKLNRDYEKLKLENRDLPEFIRAYLESKVPDCEIKSSFPLKGEDGGDIDVYIPKTKTGIECKLFVNPQAEGKYLHSSISEVVKSFKKYVEYEGVKRLIAIVNLDERYHEEAEKEIKSKLANAKLSYDELIVVCFSITNLLTILSEEIQRLKKI